MEGTEIRIPGSLLWKRIPIHLGSLRRLGVEGGFAAVGPAYFRSSRSIQLEANWVKITEKVKR